MRYKNRYLLFLLEWTSTKPMPSPCTKAVIYKELVKKLTLLFGEVGQGIHLNSMSVLYYHPLTKLVIVRADRDAIEDVKRCLMSLLLINTCPASFIHVKTSGILRCLKAAAEHYTRLAFQAQFTPPLPFPSIVNLVQDARGVKRKVTQSTSANGVEEEEEEEESGPFINDDGKDQLGNDFLPLLSPTPCLFLLLAKEQGRLQQIMFLELGSPLNNAS